MATPKLVNYDEFKKLLSDYEIGERAKEVLSEVRLAVLASPTSGGRNSTINKLVETGKYEFSVSDTTRPPRVNNGVKEQDGVEYNFLSEEDFLEGLRKQEYIEAALIHEQQVSGTSVRGLEDARHHSKIALIEADYKGVRNVLGIKPDTHAIFIIPPDFSTWMHRLESRGGMDQDEFLNRLRSAEKEFEYAIKEPKLRILINDNLDVTASGAQQIIEEDMYPDKEQAIETAWLLLNRIKHELYS